MILERRPYVEIICVLLILTKLSSSHLNKQTVSIISSHHGNWVLWEGGSSPPLLDTTLSKNSWQDDIKLCRPGVDKVKPKG